MTSTHLPFRQVHLDFHTSPYIQEIGSAFDKKEWQQTLQDAAVNSITCFSKCHHGLSYHPTSVGKMHPHLRFDLLRAQIEACREIDIRVPIYLSAGFDNTITESHPEWREVNAEGCTGSLLKAGFHKLCFNTPYLDHLCRQIEEAVGLFPEGHGIFLDIVAQGSCCCKWCLSEMEKLGMDSEREEDRARHAELVLDRYYAATTAACKIVNANMPVFHNKGHIERGRRDRLQWQSHLELESLPTGGWGYDHFSESATYAAQLGYDFLGMTGKFHTSWGEFGGFKHPNALLYECSAMIAFGAKCSIGDQLHPNGKLDASTYAIIGEVYRDIKNKEAWCDRAVPVVDIGVLSSEAEHPQTAMHNDSDSGVSRVLLEGHHLFALIDRECDFANYRLLVLPDNIEVDNALLQKLRDYLSQGGKLLLSGRSGFKKDDGQFGFNIGAEFLGSSPYQPDYILPAPDYQSPFVQSPLVMYARSERIKIRKGEGKSLGDIFDPYFNRTFRHFCSHQHAPNLPKPSGYDCGVLFENIAYIAHPIFTLYRAYGAVAYRDYVLRIIDSLLAENRTIQTNLPSEARVTVNRLPESGQWMIHLLYANKIRRGGKVTFSNIGSIEVIEDLIPLNGITLSIQSKTKISKVTLEPQGLKIPCHIHDETVEVKIDSFRCHQIIVLHEEVLAASKSG